MFKYIIFGVNGYWNSFPEGKPGMFELDTPMRILRIFYQLSRRFSSHEERFKLFQTAISAAERSIYTVVDEVAVQGQQHGKATSKKDLDPVERRTVNSEQLEELERLAVKKIEAWAGDGRLYNTSSLSLFYTAGRRWTKPDSNSPREFVRNFLGTEDGLVAFITAFLGRSISHGMRDYVGKISWRIDLKSIGDFVPVKEIEEKGESHCWF